MIRAALDLLKEKFREAAHRPPSEDQQLYNAFAALDAVREEMKDKMGFPEQEDAVALWRKQTADKTAWSFDRILFDKLEEKGWPISHGQENTPRELFHLVTMLEVQQTQGSRLEFQMALREYSKPGHEYSGALKFVKEHLNEFTDTLKDLRNFGPEDLKPRHQVVFKAPEKPLPLNSQNG